jgi:hypothetical protein
MRLRLAVLAGLAVIAASPAAAQSCRALLDRGARVVSSYVMDFGPRDKLYVYILRHRNGATDKCTSQRRLRFTSGQRA